MILLSNCWKWLDLRQLLECLVSLLNSCVSQGHEASYGSHGLQMSGSISSHFPQLLVNLQRFQDLLSTISKCFRMCLRLVDIVIADQVVLGELRARLNLWSGSDVLVLVG